MDELKDEIGAILQTKKAVEGRKSSENEQDLRVVKEFMTEVVGGAFAEFADALRAHGRDAQINIGPTAASFVARYQGNEEFNFRVERQRGTFVAPIVQFTDRSDGKRYGVLGYFRSGQQNYGAADVTRDEIVRHMTNEYRMTMSPRP